MSTLRALLLGCEVALAASGGALVYAAMQAAPDPLLGARGKMRARARREHPLMRMFDPWLRLSSRAIASVLPARAHAALSTLLRRSGNVFGLSAEELCALALTASAVLAGSGAVLASAGRGSPLILAAAGAGLGVTLPFARTVSAAMRRRRTVDRDLPAAMDVIGLCMSAGLDLARALQLWLERSSVRDSAIAEEIERVLQALSLGHTRAEALRAFADDVPSVAVIDWVNAVISAEQKGTPLAVIIETQSRMLRMRRSIAAEKAAARAALWLLLPLLMLLGAIMLVLFAPFFITGAGF